LHYKKHEVYFIDLKSIVNKVQIQNIIIAFF
jgi:hypothetical protein